MRGTSSERDAEFMREAIALAMRGRGAVEPNPMVGCVIVKDGQVIARGFHERFGGPHAEPNALAGCDATGATVYTTLEPCCHTGKKTPPCTPLLIAARVARVVIGCLDPNPHVNGQGAAQLRLADIDVVAPVLEREAQQLIAPFLLRVREYRPYVTLKWAESADGKVAGPGGSRMQISNAVSMSAVHRLRSRCDAIAVGIDTVIKDDPLLTVRHVTPMRTLRRVVFDTHLRMPADSRLVRTAGETPLLILTSPDDAKPLRDPNVIVRTVPVDSAGRLSLADAVRSIGDDATHLLVEPGPTLARSFIAAGLADRVWIFRSQKVVGDESAPAAVVLPETFVATGTIDLDGDVLAEYLNRSGAAYFSPAKSADFVQN